jgi:hypothetical protein
MAYNPINLGPTTTSNSQAVVLPSDQTTIPVTLLSGSTGGDSVGTYATPSAIVSASGSNATVIKNSPGKVTGWYIYNSNVNARKVAFHNTAGTPTAGSGVYLSIVIPGLAATNVSFPSGINFSSGIGITTVTGLPNTDSNGVGLNDLVINIFWK